MNRLSVPSKARIFRLSFAFSVAVFLFLKPNEVALACIWTPDDWELTYSFFDPFSTGNPDYVPFYFSLTTFRDAPESRVIENVADWQKFLGNKVTQEDIRKLIYDLDYSELEALLTSIQRPELVLSSELAANSASRLLKQERRKSAVNYLLYARSCEPQVSYSDDYWEEPVFDAEEREWLIREGVDRYQAAPSDFLKLRYAFQVVRLAHYKGEFLRCVELFDQLVKPLGAVGPLYWWALAHKAGAMQELNFKAEANYLYIKVFQHSPGMNVRVFRSMKIDSQEDWEDLLGKCKDKEEQATLYFMRGIKPFSVSLEEMEHIAQINPEFAGLQMLMSREINKIEYDFLGYGYDASFPIPIEAKETHITTEAYVRKLMAFAQKQARLEYEQSAWWALAGHYLEFVLGENEKAKAGFTALAQPEQPAEIQKYARIYQLLLRIGQAKTITAEEENALILELNTLSDGKPDPHGVEEKVHRFVFARLEKIYANMGETGKSYLCQHNAYDLQYAPNEAVIRSLIVWLKRVNSVGATDMDDWLLQRMDAEKPEIYLLEMAGTMALSRHDYSQAIADFETIGAVSPEELHYYFLDSDPFAASISDCQDCALSVPIKVRAKLDLALELVMLEKQSLGKNEEAALASFKLGVAWYNMSYFGHSWKTLRYFRTSNTWMGMVKPVDDSWYADIDDTSPVTDMDRPLAFFVDAAALTKDPELKAKAVFFAAKCQQNKLYMQGFQEEELLQQTGSNYLLAFETMKSYRKTAFFKEALNECGRFRVYLNKR